MARIAGVDLPRTKRVEIGLTYIYGIGRNAVERHPDGGRREPGHPREGSVGRRRPEDQPGDRGAGPRRGRSPQGDLDEHQAAGRDRQLSRRRGIAATCRCAASARARTRARARARARARLPRRRLSRPMAKKATAGRRRGDTPKAGKAPDQEEEDVQEARREARGAPRLRPHSGVVQQHDRDDHRRRRARDRVVERRRHRLQGIAQGHAVRGDAGGDGRGQRRQDATACGRSRCG